MSIKRRSLAIAFLCLLLGVLLLSPATVLAAGSTIEFVTFRLDSPVTGQSTWYYKVTSAARPAISHVTFALNLGCLQVVSAGTWNGTDLNALNPGGGNPVVGSDATTGITGVKFDAGFAGREVRYYYFTVNGNYAAEPIAAVAKSGTELENFTVTGPSPTCAPPGNPAIDINKTPDLQQVVSGSNATFTIRVQNTGNVALSNVAVSDPLAPNCNRTIGALAVGAVAEYTCTVIATADFTNVASVSGQDAIGRVVQDSDPADVDVINPAIDINKTPDLQQVVNGGTATFTIRVQNTGDVVLSNVAVTDPLAPNCNRTIGTLAVGAFSEYTCSVTATADFTNVATVNGQAPNGAPVQDSDPANVDVINPAITINKTPDQQTVLAGSSVTFNIAVQNTGDVTLSNVVVTDALVPACNKTIGTLAVGASHSYVCTVSNVTADFVNVAVVTGQAPNGVTVTDDDPATVTVLQPATLGDFVWEDLNGNGVQEAGEAGIAGVVVKLYDCSNNLVNSATTNAAGNYQFTVTPGSYTIEFTVPTGYVFSAADRGGNDATDSDANPATGRTPCVTVGSGATNNTLDAGLYRPALLGDFVWEDLNGNGVQDAGEPGIAGVPVKLYDCSTNLVNSTTTNAAGNYQFSVAPGSYTIQVMVPTDYSFSAMHQGGNNAADSDVDPATGRTPCVTVASGTTNNNLDAGLYRPATLGDFVWADQNSNGVQEAGEAGIAGVPVKLYDCNNNLLNSTTTNAAGLYQFSVAPGNYVVQVIAPTGYLFSAPNQGGNDATDSDADPTTGRLPCVTVASGGVNNTLDAGLRPATGKVTPTGTECPAYVDNSATNLNAVSYQTKGSTITTVSSPGAFIYFSRVSADSTGNLAVEIRQTKQSGISKFFGINEGPKLYSLNCGRVDNLTVSENLTTGVVTITGSGLTPGSVYVLYQKYSSNSLVGATVADRRATYNYGFATFQGGALVDFDPDGLNVAPAAASSATAETVAVFMPLVVR